MNCAFLVHELKQVLAGQILHRACKADQLPIIDFQFLLATALPLETQFQNISPEVCVAAAQRGRAEAPIGMGIMFVADPETFPIQQADYAGDGAFLAQPPSGEIDLNRPSQIGQRAAEARKTVIFHAFALAAKFRVIAILFAATCVIPSGQQVTVWLWTEPDTLIGGRKGNGIQSVDLVAVGYPIAVAIEIRPAVANVPPRNSGHVVTHIAKSARRHLSPSCSGGDIRAGQG